MFNTFVEESQNNIQHMSSTIDDFRDFFNPNKSKKLFSLYEITQKTISFVKDTFDNHNIIIQNDTHEDAQIYGFENEFAQVLLNILNNSKDALIKTAHPNGLIKIGIQRHDNIVRMIITDNGSGVPSDLIDRLFEPYFTTKDKKEGTGIGLYMSKMIIENSMNGSIQMESLDHGMQTTISLQAEPNA